MPSSIEFLSALGRHLDLHKMQIFYTNLGKIEHGATITKQELLFRRGRRDALTAKLFTDPRRVLLCDSQATKDRKSGHSYFVPIEYKRSRKAKYHRIIADGESVRAIADSLGIGE
jgi:hypothetical protein